MNGTLGHMCTYIGQTGSGEPPEDDAMNEMPSRLEIRALAVWGRARYLSVTEAPHNIESLQIRDLRLSKQAALTTVPEL